MQTPRIPAVALGCLLLCGATRAWGRDGPPAATHPAATTGAAVPTFRMPPMGKDGQPLDPAGLAAYEGIVRDTDAAMDCPQLNAELQSLTARIAALPPQPDWTALSGDIRPAANPNAVGLGHMAASAALSRVPVVGGVLAAVSERPFVTDARMARQLAQVEQAQQATVAHALLHARRARVTRLFNARGCKASDFDPPPVMESDVPSPTAAAVHAAPVATDPATTKAAPSK